MALVAAIETLDASLSSSSVRRLSPLFNYYTSRWTPSSLTDVPFADAITAALRDGIARSSMHAPAMTPDGARSKPSLDAFDDARKQRLANYAPGKGHAFRQLSHANFVDEWRSSLALARPVVALFLVTPEYWSLSDGADTLATPHVPLQPDWHAVVVTGYDFDRAEPAFRVLDSRGASFGDGGSWWLPASIVSTTMVWESHALQRLTYDE